jgi:hypothetical protein
VLGNIFIAVARVQDMARFSGDRAVSVVLVIGLFYFSFMILDRLLSLAYGFNFQPYGPYVPPGFTIWGHAANGSMAALGLYITFRIFDHGKSRGSVGLQVLGLLFFFVIGAVIPYVNDAEHLVKNGAESTLLVYIAFNDLYVFGVGVLAYRYTKTNRRRLLALAGLGFLFLIIHFGFYARMFPEFYWS